MNFPIGYGINLEQGQEAAVGLELEKITEQTQEHEAEEVVVCPTPKRKRARVQGGKFAADNPATVADEAWAES